MSKESMHRARLIEARFTNAQESSGQIVNSLFAESASGVFELSREEIQVGDGGTIFRHTMEFRKHDGVVRRAVLENGEVTRVDGFGENDSQERMSLQAKGLFHTLRKVKFTSGKQDMQIGY